MIIVGIDPGIATIGYGVIEYNNPKQIKVNIDNVFRFIKYLTCGTIVTNNDLSSGKRFQIIHKKITNLLKTYQPEVLSLERIFFCKNQRTLIVVSQATGIIILATSRLKIPIYEFTPSEVKFMITKNGKATKKQMKIFIEKIFLKNKIPKQDDSIDALAIAISYILRH